ncbi:putative P450 monooxygenase [Dissoconium aciculare CBS 342.82]|uniref:P450 monooxygenase n=1 Tax=Dissoconium aciculare CBS 342.82 TaxID=1314786 RepID=A0A6J3M8Z5_9PEZI|nr:putative P450 monooxygenase [Dissoconium aciculare CBS 342.82]KAF1824353.1 putative P450 monooxygenase [Dissoconium aciculare CBS 342.82]
MASPLIHGLLSPITETSLFYSIFLLLALFVFTLYFYRTYLHPLSSIPGPILYRLTSLPLYIHSYLGRESSVITSLHAQYGPIVRIGPNEVVIADGAALPQIYTPSENASRGGFVKAPCYQNFHSENGIETIFSTVDPEHRKPRARAVMPLFGAGEVRKGIARFDGVVGKLVRRLRAEARGSLDGERGREVDLLVLARMWALDSVSGYLFGESYGALEQGKLRLDAAAYVESITAYGRFFFLPNALFLHILSWSEYLFPSTRAEESLARVDAYVTPLIERAASGGDGSMVGTFQDRLLKAGISKEETSVQMKDVIFAGTDTTAMNLATILWWLVKKPEVHELLRQEILQAEKETPSDPTGNNIPTTSTTTFLTGGTNTLPYLDAVIREGLRLSRANPTRLPRIVPPCGYTEYFLPAGTQISEQISTLHGAAGVYEEPGDFRPERWLLPQGRGGARGDEDGGNPPSLLHRDFFPFGLGARTCIARALATQEVICAVRGVVRDGVLMDCVRARVVDGRIRIREWFNAQVVGGRIGVVWG